MVRVVNHNRPWWHLLPGIVIGLAVAIFAFAKGSLILGVVCLVGAAILAAFRTAGRKPE